MKKSGKSFKILNIPLKKYSNSMGGLMIFVVFVVFYNLSIFTIKKNFLCFFTFTELKKNSFIRCVFWFLQSQSIDQIRIWLPVFFCFCLPPFFIIIFRLFFWSFAVIFFHHINSVSTWIDWLLKYFFFSSWLYVNVVVFFYWIKKTKKNPV